MKQQCYLAAIYFNWLVLIGGLGYLLFSHHYGFAIVWLLTLPLAMGAYLRAFPSLSQAMGYGKVDDHPARRPEAPAPQSYDKPIKVTLYTALGCPFCPIVEKRLEALKASLPLEIEKIDVTLRPQLLASKGIRAVPVLEVADRHIEGNATTEQLATLIAGQPALLSQGVLPNRRGPG